MPVVFKKIRRENLEEPSTKERIEEEMDKAFLGQLQASGRTGALISILYAVIVFPEYRTSAIPLWLFVILGLYVGRFFWIRSLRKRYDNPLKLRFISLIINLSLLSTGCGFGYASLAFMTPEAPITMLPTLLILMGILMVSTPLLSARPSRSILFVIPLLCGMVFRLSKETESIFVPTAILLCAISAFAVFLTYRFNLHTRKGVRLRIEKDDLFERIVVAKKKAEETAISKGIFLAAMSHEIRTPINGLMGMLEILKETDLDAMQANYLNTASRSAESLLQLLNDILDYSKIEVGKLELEKVPFDWIAMIGEIAMMNRVLASNKGLAFHLEIPAEGTSIVVGDPTRLRQILSNLLSNALKFTHEGSIILKTSILGETPDNLTLAISVKDTGIGIDKAAQTKLFQQYQQASSETTRRYGGTGLGLAISQHLACLMNGQITLESEAGKGSEFTLTVSFPKTTPQSLQSFVSDPNSTANGFIARVLVVEDDPISQRVAVLMLKSFGITPTVVNNASAALDVATQEKFDIIFMDSRLPDMDGFEAAKQISTRPPVNGSGAPPIIVAMSGADTPEDRAKAKECGILWFLPKPVRKREMRLCLERFADKTRPANATLPETDPARGKA
jgi:signal transduction histidine kinase/ActR/RegA family two-component response regulator